MKKRNKPLPYRVGLWLVFAVFCMQFVISYFLKEYWHGLFGSEPGSYTYILMTQLFSIAIPCIGVWLFAGRSFKRTFNVRKLRLTDVFEYTFLGICLQPVAILANMPLQNLIQRDGSIVAPPENIVQILVMILFVCVVPAFCEEFFMRGMILETVKRKGFVFSIIVTTVMFVILHGDVSSVVGYAILGFVAAFVALNANSVFAGVVVHMAFNVCGVMLDYFLNLFYTFDGFVGSIAFFVTTGVVGLILSVILIIVANNKETKKYKSEELFCNLRDAFVNIPFVGIVLLYILYAVI